MGWQKMSTTEDANEPRAAGSRSLSKYLHSQSERPHAGRSDRQIYFWMQVSTVSLVHSSRPVNTGSSTGLPSIRSIMTDGAL